MSALDYTINNVALRQLITDIAQMTIERLEFYQNRHDGILPERVLVYRNGISEVNRHPLWLVFNWFNSFGDFGLSHVV